MIKFIFKLNEPLSDIDSFSQGFIIIETKKTLYPPKKLNSSQSMMIFISIVELLDGIRILLKDKNKKSYCFVGADSSFKLFFVKNFGEKENKLILKDSESVEILTLKENDFVYSIWNGVKIFVSEYCRFLNEEEIIYNDFQNSIKDFKKEFKLT